MKTTNNIYILTGFFLFMSMLVPHGNNAQTVEPHYVSDEVLERDFFQAVKRGDLDNAEKLLKLGIDPNSRGSHRDTPFLVAAAEGNLHMARLLMRYGADIHARSLDFESSGGRVHSGYWTALMLAAGQGHLEFCKFLIENGVDINATTRINHTALSQAIRSGKEDVVIFLLNAGANPDIAFESSRSESLTPLLYAVQNRQPAAVKALIAKGAPIEEYDKKGRTPLMHAAKNGDTRSVTALLDAGANKNAKDHAGRTALDLAEYNARIGVVAILGDVSSPSREVEAAIPPLSALIPESVLDVLWEVPLREKIANGPFITGDKVLFSDWHGRLNALQVSTGKYHWTFDVSSTRSKSVDKPLDIAIFITRNGTIFAQWRNDDALLAIDLDSGKLRWSLREDGIRRMGGISLVEADGVLYHISNRSGSIRAIESRTGKILWQFKPEGSNVSSLAIGNEILIANDAQQILYGIKKDNGTVLWRYSFDNTHSPSKADSYHQELIKLIPEVEGTQPESSYSFGLGICDFVVNRQFSKDQIIENASGGLFPADFLDAMYQASRKTICPPGTKTEEIRVLLERKETQARARISQLTVGAESLCFQVLKADKYRSLNCLDLKTGSPLVERELRSLLKSMVAWRNYFLYIDQKDLYAINAIDGRAKWALTLEDILTPRDELILIDSLLHVRSKHFLTIDVETGQVIRITDIKTRSCDGVENTLCGVGFKHLYSIDSNTGEVLWWVQRNSDLVNAIGNITISPSMIFYAPKHSIEKSSIFAARPIAARR